MPSEPVSKSTRIQAPLPGQGTFISTRIQAHVSDPKPVLNNIQVTDPNPTSVANPMHASDPKPVPHTVQVTDPTPPLNRVPASDPKLDFLILQVTDPTPQLI
jgi:hypothetical protein